MSAATNCACPCPTPEIVTVPGTPGTDGTAGTAGTNGVNAFTTTTSDVILPAAAGPVILATSFATASWMSIGQVIFISDGVDWGHFRVLTLPSPTSATLQWLDYPDDAAGTATIGLGATVSPAGVFALPAPPPTALTNSTTGTPGATLAPGVGISTLVHPLTSIVTGLGVLAIDLLTNYVPGYRFKVLKFDFITTVAGTGAGASQIFNLEIGTTNVTNTLTVTLASTAAIGQMTSGIPNPIAAANVGTATDTLSIEMAAGGTVFTAGAGYFLIEIQNMDTADAVASLNTSINTLITALT